MELNETIDLQDPQMFIIFVCYLCISKIFFELGYLHKEKISIGIV